MLWSISPFGEQQAQAGIFEAGLALIFAIDLPLDMCKTAVTVSEDAAVSVMINKVNTGK